MAMSRRDDEDIELSFYCPYVYYRFGTCMLLSFIRLNQLLISSSDAETPR